MVFSFFVDSVLTGTFSVVGLIGNTVSFFVLDQRIGQRSDVGSTKTVAVLLQGIAASNIGLLWSVFIMHVVPRTELIVIMLRPCGLACDIVETAFNPVYMASQTALLWTTVVLAAFYTFYIKDPRGSRVGRDSTRVIRFILAAVMTVSVTWTVPVSVNSWVVLVDMLATTTTGNSSDDRPTTSLEEVTWYRVVYVDLISFVTLFAPLLCIVVLLMTSSRRRRLPEGARRQESSGCQQLLRGRSVTAGVVCCLIVCYIPETVLQMAKTGGRAPKYPGWLFFLSAFSRFFVVLNSSIAVPFSLFVRRHFEEPTEGERGREGGIGGGGESLLTKTKEPRGGGGGIYRRDNVTKVTLKSENERHWNEATQLKASEKGKGRKVENATEEETSLTFGDSVFNI